MPLQKCERLPQTWAGVTQRNTGQSADQLGSSTRSEPWPARRAGARAGQQSADNPHPESEAHTINPHTMTGARDHPTLPVRPVAGRHLAAVGTPIDLPIRRQETARSRLIGKGFAASHADVNRQSLLASREAQRYRGLHRHCPGTRMLGDGVAQCFTPRPAAEPGTLRPAAPPPLPERPNPTPLRTRPAQTDRCGRSGLCHTAQPRAGVPLPRSDPELGEPLQFPPLHVDPLHRTAQPLTGAPQVAEDAIAEFGMSEPRELLAGDAWVGTG